ncbi:g7745 [Coccomyxa viridis]|uniref:DNA polymerase n=1 Tax=Coccomyxa viridis TaxID=1274662 RepID=A0ABP1FYN4_9CHLO
MDSSKRRLSGPGPTGTSQKRPNVSAPGVAVEDEAIEEQMAILPESPEDDADDIDQHMLEEDLELHLGEAGRNWERPAPPPLDPSTQSLAFQQLEVDYYIGAPNQQVFRTDLLETPIIRMYGVTEHGNSVCAFVHGFQPYFYIEAPRGFGPDDCDSLCSQLNRMLADRNGKGGRQSKFCLKVEMAQKQSIWHYQPVKSCTFLRVVVATPNLVTQARGMLETGFQIDSLHRAQSFTTYESHVLFALRFMIDCSISGGNWVELKAGAYKLLSMDDSRKQSHCQLEVHINYADIISHPAEGEWLKLAPFRILSVDIECAGRKGHFPEAEKDPVIQIASMVTEQGKETPTVRNVLTLQSCAPIVGAEVMSFDNEAALLKRWRDLVIETDPDIIIGYNICNFDLPYLIKRAETLKVEDFPYWGRNRKIRLKMRDAQFSSKAYGTREYKEISIDGRIQFDLLVALQRDHKLSSYSLNAVSAHFLGEQKEDVHHSIISDLQNGNEETRRRLAVYCLKDAYLPQRLVDKLMYMYNYIEMARVTGVPMSFLLTRGQSIKVFSQILRKARQRNLLVPNLKSHGPGGDGVAYEGATVLEAKQGFYSMPVATLDFASLYPSIMMAHNLCYTTLLPRNRVHELPAEDVLKTPNGDHFVKAHKQKGILPEILEELLSARKRAKTDLKAATNPFMKAVLDGRQLALKVSANSVYGFTGATIGKMPCLEISSSTTSFGRNMIDHTKRLVEEKFQRKNGYEADCDVIYGDTDSVMVNFRVKDIARAMELGQEAAAFVSKTFIKPIKLEFEKVYKPYLLMNKKRYAGLLWTNPEKFDKMDTKGIETVRRDNCQLVRTVVSTCLDRILIEEDIEGAKEYVRNTISDLLMNRLDLSLLVITKGLTKDDTGYAMKLGHVELAKKMRKRDPATAPTLGDRVAYVHLKAAKGVKAYDKAEDPIYALEHNLPIDFQHYLDHHLELPLTRLFGPVMNNPKELMTGAHTRSIALATPSTHSGGIMRFAKVRLSCLGCRTPLPPGTSDLCKHCRHKEVEVYAKSLASVNELEQSFAALWTQCQRCQGSLHQDVLCTSRDCPIFYRRKKVQKDLGEAHSLLQRFTDW